MHPKFAEWYRPLLIQADEKLLKSRWALVESTASSLTAPMALDLVRLSFGLPVQDDAAIAALKQQLKVGADVKAKIDCGRKPVGYVLIHDLGYQAYPMTLSICMSPLPRSSPPGSRPCTSTPSTVPPSVYRRMPLPGTTVMRSGAWSWWASAPIPPITRR